MPTKAPASMRTYEIVAGREKYRVTVPDDWKVTFGPVAPGARGYADLALRFWEAENKQRAIFRNVDSFRDLSIPYSRQLTSKSGESSWSEDDSGYEMSEHVNIETEWISEDA